MDGFKIPLLVGIMLSGLIMIGAGLMMMVGGLETLETDYLTNDFGYGFLLGLVLGLILGR